MNPLSADHQFAAVLAYRNFKVGVCVARQAPRDQPFELGIDLRSAGATGPAKARVIDIESVGNPGDPIFYTRSLSEIDSASTVSEAPPKGTLLDLVV